MTETKDKKALATLRPNEKNLNWVVPKNTTEAIALAKTLSASGLVPKDFIGKPENCLIAMGMGAEIGLNPFQSIQNIAVINGRPCIWGDCLLGVVVVSKDFEAIVETLDEKTMTATCKVKRKGREWVTVTFSKEDAEKAGLWNKQGTWQSYPKRMLKYRARGFALRDAFPDKLKGIYIREEVEDFPQEATIVAPPAPRTVEVEGETVDTKTGEVNDAKPDTSSLPITEAQRRLIFAKLRENKVDETVFKKWLSSELNIESTKDLTNGDMDAVLLWIDSGNHEATQD